jgi:hypothetical protein
MNGSGLHPRHYLLVDADTAAVSHLVDLADRYDTGSVCGIWHLHEVEPSTGDRRLCESCRRIARGRAAERIAPPEMRRPKHDRPL